MDCRVKRVGVLSKPQRVRSTWGLRPVPAPRDSESGVPLNIFDQISLLLSLPKDEQIDDFESTGENR